MIALALQIIGGWFVSGMVVAWLWSLVRGYQKRKEREALEMAWARAGRHTIETEYRRVGAI